tara:strand:- start:83 stop:475 length:393 start_codon:yes stop_codon:yes gene_type:complete
MAHSISNDPLYTCSNHEKGEKRASDIRRQAQSSSVEVELPAQVASHLAGNETGEVKKEYDYPLDPICPSCNGQEKERWNVGEHYQELYLHSYSYSCSKQWHYITPLPEWVKQMGVTKEQITAFMPLDNKL